MKDGKFVRAHQTFFSALEIIKKKKKMDPFIIALRAIEFVKPMFELKARRLQLHVTAYLIY